MRFQILGQYFCLLDEAKAQSCEPVCEVEELWRPGPSSTTKPSPTHHQQRVCLLLSHAWLCSGLSTSLVVKLAGHTELELSNPCWQLRSFSHPPKQRGAGRNLIAHSSH